MARKRRLHKRYGRKRSTNSGSSLLKANPPLFTDVLEFIGPGFASYAATRFLTRVAAVQLAQKKPSWGKHAGAITSIASFAAAWFGAHRVKFLERYHTPMVVGSAIAMLQSLIQLYVPAVGQLLADPTVGTSQIASLSVAAPQNLPPGVELLDEDPNEYMYNDSFDNGAASPQTQTQQEEDLLADLNLDDSAGLEANLGSLGV